MTSLDAARPDRRRKRALPSAPDAIQERYYWRVLHLATLLMVPATAAFAVVYAIRERWFLVALEVLATLAFLLIWVIARRTTNPKRGLEQIAMIAWLALAGLVLAHGGLQSPALLWLFMLAPLLVLAGSQVAMSLAVATVVFVGVVYVATSTGHLEPFTDVPPLQRAISGVLVLGLFLLFAHNALAWRTRIADELAQARDAAIEALKTKERFIANLNHELRTPLNAIVGSAQLLTRDPDSPQRGRLLDAMQKSADHLLLLVNDVLDHSRLEAGKVPLEDRAFDPRALLTDVGLMLGAAAERKGLTMRIDTDASLPAACRGDPTRLRQVLVNLVSNAIKFTGQGGVHLRADMHLGDAGARWTLQVDDTGPGLSPEERGRVFDAYVQADASINRRHGGSGLGLTICRDLVELMAGRIEVSESPQGGARFVVDLPLREAEPVAEPSHAGQAAPASPLRVLVVEDNVVNLMVTEAMLRHTGAEVVTADSGQAALQRMADMPFDLVLMDLQMPDLDGLAVTRVRRDEERRTGLPRVRIVALTGEVLDHARDQCVAAGMDGFLSKPLSLPDLVALVS